jgi:hypothetical protein
MLLCICTYLWFTYHLLCKRIPEACGMCSVSLAVKDAAAVKRCHKRGYDVGVQSLQCCSTSLAYVAVWRKCRPLSRLPAQSSALSRCSSHSLWEYGTAQHV